jgi:hypothetical protein
MIAFCCVMPCEKMSGTRRNGTGSHPRLRKMTAPMRAAVVCSAALMLAGAAFEEVRIWSVRRKGGSREVR